MLSLLWAQTKIFFKSISNSHISLSFLLIWNWNDKYVHTLRSFLESHTPFQTKMGKVYTRFQTQNGAKTLPEGVAHTYMAYIREYPRVSFIGRFRKMRFHSLLKVSGKWNRKFRLNRVIIVGHVIWKILKISLGNRETTKLKMFMLCYVPIIYTCTELQYL